MKRAFILLITMVAITLASAQNERWDIRKGNRAYGKGEFQSAELNYRRGLERDSLSVKARYNLANALYRNQNPAAAEQEGAKLTSDSLMVKIGADERSKIFHNLGNYALSQRKWSEAVEAYKNSLRVNPSDMETKSNLAYAQKMLKRDQDKQNQDQKQDQNQDQDNKQDQNKDQNQNNDQNQNKDQKQNQDHNKDQDQNQPPPKITPQAAQQMLQAIQNKENETQEKVKREKAKMYERQQREKNW